MLEKAPDKEFAYSSNGIVSLSVLQDLGVHWGGPQGSRQVSVILSCVAVGAIRASGQFPLSGRCDHGAFCLKPRKLVTDIF